MELLLRIHSLKFSQQMYRLGCRVRIIMVRSHNSNFLASLLKKYILRVNQTLKELVSLTIFRKTIQVVVVGYQFNKFLLRMQPTRTNITSTLRARSKLTLPQLLLELSRQVAERPGLVTHRLSTATRRWEAIET